MDFNIPRQTPSSANRHITPDDMPDYAAAFIEGVVRTVATLNTAEKAASLAGIESPVTSDEKRMQLAMATCTFILHKLGPEDTLLIVKDSEQVIRAMCQAMRNPPDVWPNVLDQKEG